MSLDQHADHSRSPAGADLLAYTNPTSGRDEPGLGLCSRNAIVRRCISALCIHMVDVEALSTASTSAMPRCSLWQLPLVPGPVNSW